MKLKPFLQSRAWLALFSLTACTVTSSHSQLAEAIRLYTGEAGVVDDLRARELLEQSAQDGDSLSIMWLARVYSTGRMTFEADKAKAISLAESVIDDIEAMANEGNSEAMLLVGTAYAEGLAKDINPEQAVQWYRRAAALNNTLALHNLGNVYASGTGVPQSDAKAVEWWLQAAENGDAIPQLRLGVAYEEGKGVVQNIETAKRWYAESARRGNQAAIDAINRLSLNEQ